MSRFGPFSCRVLCVHGDGLRCCVMGCGVALGWFRGPGGDRLSRTLGCSIMGAGGFHVRVRDGIGCGSSAMATRLSEPTPRDVFVVVRAMLALSRGSGSGAALLGVMGMACVLLGERPAVDGCCAWWGGMRSIGRLGPVS